MCSSLIVESGGNLSFTMVGGLNLAEKGLKPPGWGGFDSLCPSRDLNLAHGRQDREWNERAKLQSYWGEIQFASDGLQMTAIENRCSSLKFRNNLKYPKPIL